MVKISNKRLRERFKKVIQLLYPEYKHVRIKKNFDTVVSKKKYWLPRLFSKKTTVGYGVMVHYYLPTKLTLLKYDNKDFLSTVIEEMTSVEMRGENLITYLYTSVVTIKYPHVFKRISIPEIAYFRGEPYYKYKQEKVARIKVAEKFDKVLKVTPLMKLQSHPLYYEYMVIATIAIIVLFIILFNGKL